MVSSYKKKKKIADLIKQLNNNWGKPKVEKYFHFNLIEKYFENNNHRKHAYHIISDREVSDLDFEDLFIFIDRTSSKIGQQFLYYKLRTICDLKSLLAFDLLSQKFDKNALLRLDCQLELSKLNSRESYDLESLINGNHPTKPLNMWLAYLASFGSVVTIIIALFKPIFILGIIPILILNWLTHYKNKLNIDLYVNGVVQLRRSMMVARKLSSYSKIQSFYKDFNFFKRIDSFSRKIKFIGFEKDLGNDFSGTGWALTELVKIFFNLEYIIFYSFIDSIKKERDSIDKLFCFIGEIDAAISTASLRAGNVKNCKPEFVNEKQIFIEKMVHPLIENCVSNDFNLAGKSMLLTGSNMSGKTTFIRTIAVNSILAQTLHFCFAKKYLAPFFKVHSSIRITDDLLDDTSYYLQEVHTIKNLLKASENKNTCLFVLDEIFKGTNTIERVSAGKAILSYLNKENHIVFVSTHDIELTELLENDGYELYHFREQVTNDDLYFDHKLKQGRLTTRNAIKILELKKYPAEVINEAKSVAKNHVGLPIE